MIHQLAEVLIDVFDHAVAGGSALVEALVGKALDVLLRSIHGAVRRVKADVGKERLLGIELLFGPDEGGVEEEVRAEAFGLNYGVIVQQDVIKVLGCLVGLKVTPLELAKAPRGVDQHLVKATFLGQVGLLIPEVPFAENAGLVARLLEDLRHGDHFLGEAFTVAHGMGDTHFERVASTHQGRAGWRAGGADVKITETARFGVEGVNVWGFQEGVAHAGEIPHALVIGEDENDVGFVELALRALGRWGNACAPAGRPLLALCGDACVPFGHPLLGRSYQLFLPAGLVFIHISRGSIIP